MTTYAMKNYNAAPQHKKKLKVSAVERTLDFATGPTDATFGKAQSWAAGDKIEFIGVRPDQVLVGVTIKVIARTTSEMLSGHSVSVVDSNGTAFAFALTGREASLNAVQVPYETFFQPVQFTSSDTLDVVISGAFTTGIVKITAYFLEEDRA